MQNSKIEWTDHTFNPWWGCQRVSPGCEHCYAETMANRYGHHIWGPAKTTARRAMSDNYWRQPVKWNEAARKEGRRARVFCASMADVFEDHPGVIHWREWLFTLIMNTAHLDWLLLTKRPENIRKMVPREWLMMPQPNVWYGTSVENQEYADKRIPLLLQVPARVRFLSCEPLLGPVDLTQLLVTTPCWHCGNMDGEAGRCYCGVHIPSEIHWVIVGGESGPGARPMEDCWARSLVQQCQASSIAPFVKQMGSVWARSRYIPTRDSKGGYIGDFPVDLQVREFPL